MLLQEIGFPTFYETIKSNLLANFCLLDKVASEYGIFNEIEFNAFQAGFVDMTNSSGHH